jgi:hypothetical protein
LDPVEIKQGNQECKEGELELIATVKDITGLKNSSQKIGHFDFANHHE